MIPQGSKISPSRRHRVARPVKKIFWIFLGGIIVAISAGGIVGLIDQSHQSVQTTFVCPNIGISANVPNNDYHIDLPESPDWCYAIPTDLQDTWKGIVNSPMSLGKVAVQIAGNTQDVEFVKQAMVNSLETGIIDLNNH